MHKPTDMSLWQGRVDNEETPSLRWHQVIKLRDEKIDLGGATTLLGFACDEGVKRNQGRIGAHDGPKVIRSALANLAYHHQLNPFDAGDVACEAEKLEEAQLVLAQQVSSILKHNGRPIVLGGGHEMAWGSFLGMADFLGNDFLQKRIGIINLDAHFDLRNPGPQANSGTPFRQISQWCEQRKRPFNYLVLGINPTANTQALFEYAKQKNVRLVEDVDCTLDRLGELERVISAFLNSIDELYLTICLDVFSACHVPGVSAPSAVGVEPVVVIKLLKKLKFMCKQHRVTLRVADVAEMNPEYDQDNRTAKLAARLVDEISNFYA